MIARRLTGLLDFGKLIFYFLLAISVVVGCDDEEPDPVDNLTVDRFEPLAALPGDTIVIYGTGFESESVRNVVQFSSSRTLSEIPLAQIISSSETEMTAIVPAFTQSGFVKVAVGPFSALSKAPFLLSPSISVVEPASAKAGEQVTIGGQNFTSDTSALVLFVGDVLIDSIFGASTSQIAFPLPFNVTPGPTQIRLGIKIQEDTVFAPPADFVVIDADNPSLINLNPAEGTPGTEITLFGANFNPDETTVNFGSIEVTEFLNITPEQITFNVPDLPPGVVNVAVTTVKSNGQPATTSTITFTVLEVIEIPVFYWSHSERLVGEPGGVSQIVDGQKKSLTNLTSFTYRGLSLSSDKNSLYIVGGTPDDGQIYKAATSTFANASLLNSSNFNYAADIFFHENKLYYTRTAEDLGVWVFDLLTPNKAPKKLYELQVASGFAFTPFTARAGNIKVSGSYVYWTESFGAENALVRGDLSNPASEPEIIFSNTSHSELSALLAFAIEGNKIYLVNSPYNLDDGLPTGNSSIFEGNLSSPSTALKKLHDGNVGKITDIECSDGFLYYMNYAEDQSGGIYKTGATQGSIPEPVVENIAYGAYFVIAPK